MEELLQQLSALVEAGKIDKQSPYPSTMKGEPGAVEVTMTALHEGVDPYVILNDGLIRGLNRVGEKFARGEAFIPNMLIAARTMSAAMEQLKPFLASDVMTSRGTLVLGTVQGDLHDIGKNLVKMIMQSGGWNVVDLGTDVPPEEFTATVAAHEGAIVGVSALLTTTMLNMKPLVRMLKANDPSTRIVIGGAPVSQSFCDEIGADCYFADPYSFARAFAAGVPG
jgi:methanogenic corrinoid protein MtbC1